MFASYLFSIVGVVIMLGLFLGMRLYTGQQQKRAAVASLPVAAGMDALRAGFMHTRAPGESEPVCVVGAHYPSRFSAEMLYVGVSNFRVLVFKGHGPMHSFPYDYVGEHLSSVEKERQGKGFFHWKHGDKGDFTGYCPIVKNYPPFVGEEWWFFPDAYGFPQQKANLRQFARIFYFQWFYD